MSSLEFRKCFTKFKISIDLFQQLTCSGQKWSLVLKTLTFEHVLAKRTSCEIYTAYKGARGASPTRNGKLTISKLKSSSLSLILDETMQLVMGKSRFKTGAWVSDEFALFNWSSSVYVRLIDLPFV